MAISRNTIKTGPAIVIYDGASIYFKGGLTINETIETFLVESDVHGKGDERVSKRMATVSGVPVGAWKNLGVLFPHLNAKMGKRLHGDTDKALVIHSLAGEKWTFHNGAVRQMPELIISPRETMLGNMEFVCRTKDAADPADANSLVTKTTEAFADTTFSTAEILTQVCTLNWGTSPWDDFRTADGVRINLNTTWSPIPYDVDDVDEELTGLDIECRFRPIGIAQADIDAKLNIQGNANAATGASLNARGTDLVITGTSVYILLTGMAAKSQASNFGLGNGSRHGEMVAVATRTFEEGVANQLLYVGTEEPEA